MIDDLRERLGHDLKVGEGCAGAGRRRNGVRVRAFAGIGKDERVRGEVILNALLLKS